MKTQREDESHDFIENLENQSEVRNQSLITTGRRPSNFGFSDAKIQNNYGREKR